MKLETRNLKLGTTALLLLLFPMLGKAVEGYNLVCDAPVYTFGTVDQTAVITNVFMIRNEGDLTYVHKYTHTSCGCTKGQLEKRMIGPGETVKMTAVYKAENRKGKQKKALRLISMDSIEPAIILYMEGFVNIP
ncbi:MAG: DUF1573 domain-containing protein [Kiritimatiellales bacterium]|nr:DUF1573 domain-containing protein [Kiritimatiellota bacterium]MBL7011644.1 DUF1573 domain-containing protein [Kiritimatiellales bacterium]